MKLSISNIAWGPERDLEVYSLMEQYGCTGLEIAPTRIFQEAPYDKLQEARDWAEEIRVRYGFEIPSMQSIWFGRKEKLFGTAEERRELLEHTKRAIDFAAAIGCRNLVFGCPGNRTIPDGANALIGVRFFKEIGDYAYERGTVIGIEANPPIYHTNYINDTESALELIRTVDSKGFLLNLDVGTMIQNGEPVEELRGNIRFINHIHISEPGLAPVKERELHIRLRNLLEAERYERFISIEMGRVEHIQTIEKAIKYVRNVIGEQRKGWLK